MSRILVVDDEAEMVMVLKRFFLRNGYEVETASRGDQALNILRSNSHGVDLMVLDMRMPGKRGIAVVLELEKMKINIPTIILTGSLNFSGFVEIMCTLGYSEEDVLYKPVCLEKLLSLVKKKLGQCAT